MNLDLIKLSKQDVEQVWRSFPGSPQQSVLHNQLIGDIQEDRTKLEQCTSDELLFIQARLAARRELLGFIHRSDSLHQPNPK